MQLTKKEESAVRTLVRLGLGRDVAAAPVAIASVTRKAAFRLQCVPNAEPPGGFVGVSGSSQSAFRYS